MPSPLVSVVIPAFNADSTIHRALSSVFAQGYRPLEIIVIDDSSTDDTAARVARFHGQELRLITLPRNRGEAAAMNEGIAVARGEFVAFLDADDEWLPGKLQTQVPVLIANPATSFVCSRWRQVDEAGRVTEQPDPTLFGPTIRISLWRELLARAFVLKSTVLVRSGLLAATGGFDTSLPVADDQDMWIRLALLGGVGCHPEPLTIHYKSQHSLTHRYRLREREFVLPMVRRHIETQRHKLTSSDTRHILGARYAQIGRTHYQSGQYLTGLCYLARAISLGFQPLAHLAFIVIALPPIRRLRHCIRHAREVVTYK